MIKSITPCGDDMLTVELQCTHVHYDGLNGVARCYFPGGIARMTIAELQEHRRREFAEKYEWCGYGLRLQRADGWQYEKNSGREGR